MTKFFEVTARDGAARIGKLMLGEEISTPAVIHAPHSDIVYAGSAWEPLPAAIQDAAGKLLILPHKSTPLSARKDIVEEFADLGGHPLYENLFERSAAGEFARGVVLHPFQDKIVNADLYVLGAARQLEDRPRALVEAVIRIRESTAPDTALYAPALALPENLALLAYAGIDIFDDTRAYMGASMGIYFTAGGSYPLKNLRELPCSCGACALLCKPDAISGDERKELLIRHNVYKLSEELKNVRNHIRESTLREYVEAACRTRPWLTAALRLLDAHPSYLEKRTPVSRAGTMYACSSESANRVEVRRFADRVRTRYAPPECDILLLLPCSARKPYSMSNSHQKFLAALGKYRRYVHEVIITSPLGIVPRELEFTYPAAHYDVPVTGHWDLEERAWVGGCLRDYIGRHRYGKVIAHVEGAYREICESASSDIIYSSEGSVTSRTSLESLYDSVATAVSELDARPVPGRPLGVTRAIADYQFGAGASGLLVPDGAAVKRYQVFAGKEHVASIIPEYGLLALTLAGGERLRQPGSYCVKIGDFIPRGNVLAPGVDDADPQIRPNDEVIIIGEKAFGVGRARMSGWEMVKSGRGVAVEMRDVRQT